MYVPDNSNDGIIIVLIDSGENQESYTMINKSSIFNQQHALNSSVQIKQHSGTIQIAGPGNQIKWISRSFFNSYYARIDCSGYNQQSRLGAININN